MRLPRHRLRGIFAREGQWFGRVNAIYRGIMVMSQEKKNMQWKFYEYRPGETRHDSSSEKFFGALAESLVREFVQNSLDAAVDKGEKPVRITINEKSLSKDVVAPYLGDLSGLPKHLRACGIKAKGSNIRFVVLEDFNTKGLEGGNREDFFHNDNRTKKTHGGGSHGIGKAIFSASSEINTFFGYSICGNNESVLQARAILETHQLENSEYQPYGDLIIVAKGHGDFIGKIFMRRRNEKGLSVAIPYCDVDDIELKDIEESCLRQCYLPIYQGRLEIRVGDKEFNKQNLLDHIETAPAVNLVMGYETVPEDQKIKDQVNQSDWRGNKGGSSPLFERIKKGVEELKEEADQEPSFFIELEVKLPTRKRNIAEYGKVEVLIKKSNEDQEQSFDFWRDDLLITNARRRRLPKGFSAVVMIANNPLSALLRKLEDPGHTKWEAGRLPGDVKEEYKYVRELVEFIKRLPIDIINRIKESPLNLDKNFFADYFPAFSSGTTPKSKGVGEQEYGDQVPEVIDSRPQDFDYRPKPKGFILRLKERENHPDTVTVEVAYGTNIGDGINIGDPFKNYDRRDFIFREDIKLSCKHGKRISCDGNSAVYAIKDGDFRLSMTGFDPDRELKIKIT